METHTMERFFLSPQQESLWLAYLENPERPFVTQVAVFLEGALEIDRLRRALEKVVSRHEILRTVFFRQTGMRVPFQVVLDSCRPLLETTCVNRINEYDEQHIADELFGVERIARFDLQQGPIVRALVLPLGADHQILVITTPALSADSRSLSNLAMEVIRCYADGPSGGETQALRYVQFSQWQSDLLEGVDDAARSAEAFWSEMRKSEAPTLALPFEGDVETGIEPHATSVEAGQGTLEKVESTAQMLGVPIASVLFTAWELLLSRLSGQSRFAIGVVLAGREYEELRDVMGPIARVLPIQSEVEQALSFRELVNNTQRVLDQATAWEEYCNPACTQGSVSFRYEYEDLQGWEGVEGIRYRVLATYTSGERYKLKLVVKRSVSGLRLEFHYAGSEFGAAGVGRLARNFEQLLQAAMEEPERSVGELGLLGEVEREQMVVEWNRTEAAYPEECMQELIERQAGYTPERAAVRCGEAWLSYRELNERANRLAHFLRRQGVGRGTLVGLCVERSVEMLVAVLGILKSGGAYVPISMEHPKPRLSKQLAGVGVVISERKWSGQLPPFEGQTVWLDEEPAAWAREAVSNPEGVTTGEDLAYVMYTSGSTGEPKGVEIRHRSLVNYACSISRLLKLEQEPEGLHFAMVSTLAADLGNTCIYPALVSGGCLHVLPYAVATDGHRMASYQQQYGLDVLKIVPSHLSALLSSGEGSRLLPKRYLITGGEALPRTLVEAVEASGASCRMINHYGPTETTVGSLVLPLGEYDWKRRSKGTIPLGRPIANTQVYVLDEWGNPCPIGVCGELHIGGAGVARGYLNRPELTGEKFIGDGFSKRPGGLLYKTGDRVRYLAQGEIEFLGRMDDQVKVRGYRIEPGEIESVLLRQVEVKQAVVLAREDERREKRLIAYVVVRNQATVSEAELQQRIREQLPDYMVPQAVVLLDKLPLTSNGKVDRQALPKPEEVAGQRKRSYQPPSTLTEQMVAQIWSDVLKVSPIGVNDDFFQLGGHSLLATQVISRIREQFGMGIALKALFEMPTLGSFSTVVEGAKGMSNPADAAIRRVTREAYRTKKAFVQL